MPGATLANGSGRQLALAVQSIYADMSVGLFTPDLSPTAATPLADFIAAAPVYHGYAALDVSAFAGPINVDVALSILLATGLTFAKTSGSPDTSAVVAGWYISGGSPIDLIMFGLFDNPISFFNVGDGVSFSLALPFGQEAPTFSIDS